MQEYRLKRHGKDRWRWVEYNDLLQNLFYNYQSKAIGPELYIDKDSVRGGNTSNIAFEALRNLTPKKRYYTLGVGTVDAFIGGFEKVEGIWIRNLGDGKYVWGTYNAKTYSLGAQVKAAYDVRGGIHAADNIYSYFTGTGLTVGLDAKEVGLSVSTNLALDLGIEASFSKGIDVGGFIGLTFSDAKEVRTGNIKKLERFVNGFIQKHPSISFILYKHLRALTKKI